MKIDYANRIFGLDFMRFVAIMCVLVNHALWNFPNETGAIFGILQSLGFMGVEIFFVLSGFLIGRILFRIFTSETFSANDLRYFLVRRWFRTLPTYYFILIINILIVLWIGRELPETLWLYFGFLQNTHFAMDLFFTESWSLPIEEFAYIIGPALLYLTLFLKLKISKTKQFLYITLAIILFFLITKLYYNSVAVGFDIVDWNRSLKAVVLYRIDAIYIGVLAAIISLVQVDFWKKHQLPAACIGGVLFFGLFALFQIFDRSSEAFKTLLNVWYLPLNSISIALFLPYLSQLQVKSVAIVRPITFISVISYSMYLLHYSIVLQLMRTRVDIEIMSFSGKILFSIGYIAITILLAYFLYRLYEKPLTDLRDSGKLKRYFGK